MTFESNFGYGYTGLVRGVGYHFGAEERADEAPAISGVTLSSTQPVKGVTLTAQVTASGWPTPALTYQWKRAGVDIAGATTSAYTPVQADVGAALSCAVVAANSLGTANATSSASQAVLATAPTANVAPTITSSATAIVSETVVWQGTLTADEPVTWSKTGGPDAALFALSGNTLTLQAKDFENPADANLDNVYSVTVRATDAGGLYAEQVVSVRVIDIDETNPVVLTPNLFSLPENLAFKMTLVADESVTWVIDSGPDAALFTLVGNKLSMPLRNYASPVDADHNNIYEVTVRAQDPAGNTSFVAFSITITNVNEAPTDIVLAPASPSVAEDAAVGTVVATINGVDPDGNALTYKITADPDGKFAVSGNKLVLAAALDYEQKPSHSVTLQASDGVYTYSETFTVAVTDVAEAVQPVMTSPSSFTVNENSPFSTTLTATKPVTWSLVGGADMQFFSLAGSTLSLAAKDYEAPMDFDANNTYVVQVRASDGVTQPVDYTLQIKVLEVNEAPTNLRLSNLTVAENFPVGQPIATIACDDPELGAITYTKTADPDGKFAVQSGRLVLAAPLDFEQKSSHTVSIQASDGTYTVPGTFTITVTDVDDTAPTITSAGILTLTENTAFSHTLTANESVTWAIVGGEDAALFTLAGNKLTLPAKDYEAPADANKDNVYKLTLQATDTAGNSTVQFLDLTIGNVNETPTGVGLSALSVNENVPVGTLVANISGTDPDGNALTFSKQADPDGKFTVSGTQLLTAAALDYEAKKSHSVTIRATDPGGLFVDQVFTIQVNDVAEVVYASQPGLARGDKTFDDTSAWERVGTTVTANTQTAPDGTLTADTITAGTTAFGRMVRQSQTLTATATYSATFHVKKANHRYVGIRIDASRTSDATEKYPFYDFDTGSVNTVGLANCTMTATPLTDPGIPAGWVKLKLTVSNVPATNGFFDLALTDATGATQPAAAGTEQVHVWGARFVVGLDDGSAPDTTAPVITSAANQSVPENANFSLNLTANETVAWSIIGGADAAKFTLSGNTLSMSSQDYEAAADADKNNTYVVVVQARDPSGNTSSQTITVTVTNVDETVGTLTPRTAQYNTSRDNEIIDGLDIDYSGPGNAINVNHLGVIVRNTRIKHRSRAGIYVNTGNRRADFTADNVEVIWATAPTGVNMAADENNRNVEFEQAPFSTIKNSTLRYGTANIMIKTDAPNWRVENVEGYDVHGAASGARGQFLQATTRSHNGVLTQFYGYNGLNTSFTEDIININTCNNTQISNGYLFGCNGPSGWGILFEGSAQGTVTDVWLQSTGSGGFHVADSASGTATRVYIIDGIHSGPRGVFLSQGGCLFDGGANGITINTCRYARPPANGGTLEQGNLSGAFNGATRTILDTSLTNAPAKPTTVKHFWNP